MKRLIERFLAWMFPLTCHVCNKTTKGPEERKKMTSKPKWMNNGFFVGYTHVFVCPDCILPEEY